MDKRCFVIMPFRDELKSLYEKVRSICQDLKVECRRSDEIAIGSISKGIFEEIFFADVVIADLTFSNPNVYYELAISHCIGRKTILITQEEKIPFDIGQEYVIKYTDTIDGSSILEKWRRSGSAARRWPVQAVLEQGRPFHFHRRRGRRQGESQAR